MSDIALFGLTFFCSLAICAGLRLAAPRLLRGIRRRDLRARQAAHLTPTLRLGGVGIFAALLLGALLTAPQHPVFLALVLACIPVLLSGLLEDLGHAQSAMRRLAMASTSGGIAIASTGLLVDHVGIPLLDPMLALLPLAIAFSVFATVGMIQSFNLVDGVNGMAGAVALVAALGLWGLSAQAGLAVMKGPLPVLCGAILGFLVVNFPAGRLFLGDAGAYALGFVLAWLSVLAMDRAPDLSPWAVVLVFFWPLADTILAMARRSRAGRRLDQPDRMHFHHLALRLIEICILGRILGRRARGLSNPLATLCLVPLMIAPALAGVRLWNSDLGAALAFGAFGGLFVLTYHAGIAAAPRWRRRPRAARRGPGALLAARPFAARRKVEP